MQVPKEDIEQQIFARWLDSNNYHYSAIRNESDTRSFYKGKIRKASGVRKGISDFCIFLNKKSGLVFIELKRQKRLLKSGKLGKSPSVVSPEQEKWINKANTIENIAGYIAYGAEEAINIIKELEK